MKFLKKFFKFLFFLSLLGLFLGAAGAAWLYHRLQPELPSIEVLKDVRLQVPLRVYSRDGLLLAEFGEKRRVPLAYAQIPERMRQAFLAAEDDRFFEHPGVDYQGLVRAGTQLVLTGKRRQGGSTITMQVARNFFLSREKTFTRKLKEILLSLRIERELSKQEILELYLNKIYLGNRAYGVGAAAQVYYGKEVGELDLPEIAMIAGLPKAPSTTNPIANPERALARRNYVLGRMQQLGFIDEQELAQARATPVSASLHHAAVALEAPYLAEMVRADLVERYGEETYTLGLSAYTTLDSRLQEAADLSVRDALQAYDRRHGYRGPAGHQALREDTPPETRALWLAAVPAVAGLRRALVESLEDKAASLMLVDDGERARLEWRGLKWAREYVSANRRGAPPKKARDVLAPGDLVYLYQERDKEDQPYWRLAQVPAAEGALVALDPDDGGIRALVGGYDFYRSKFNRATQARRQPGSGFKAFIYSAALESGFTPASLINDSPLVVRDASLEGEWRPQNYSGKWFGPTRLRVALYKSRNLVSIRLLRAMGVKHALEHVARFGFDTDKLPHNLTLALGSGEVTPLEMARGYAVLANGGFLVRPYYIERVENGPEGVLFRASPSRVCTECPEAQSQAQTPEAGEGTEVAETAPPAPDPDGTAPDGATQQPDWAPAPRVLNAQNQYLMTSLLKDVIRRGTGRKAMALGRSDLAGKTGTSNDQRDAWFNGFNRSLVAIVWVGFDAFSPLGRGEVGGKAALPAWMGFMRVALEGVPQSDWDMPEGIVTVRIDPHSGRRAAAGSEGAEFEVFRKGEVPEAAPQSVGNPFASSSGGGIKIESVTQELF
jgi:penicillin-binding protein 1A